MSRTESGDGLRIEDRGSSSGGLNMQNDSKGRYVLSVGCSLRQDVEFRYR
jgi:hypothetical protein